jgi:hypothetical protein
MGDMGWRIVGCRCFLQVSGKGTVPCEAIVCVACPNWGFDCHGWANEIQGSCELTRGSRYIYVEESGAVSVSLSETNHRDGFRPASC